MRDAFLSTMWVVFLIVNLALFPVWALKEKPLAPHQVEAMKLGFLALAGCWVCSLALP